MRGWSSRYVPEELLQISNLKLVNSSLAVDPGWTPNGPWMSPEWTLKRSAVKGQASIRLVDIYDWVISRYYARYFIPEFLGTRKWHKKRRPTAGPSFDRWTLEPLDPELVGDESETLDSCIMVIDEYL